jgi:hypothetical protein
MQILLEVLSKSNPDEYADLINNLCFGLISDVEDRSSLSDNCKGLVHRLSFDFNGSRVVEMLLQTSSDPVFEILYHDCIRSKISEYVAHPSANFIVQKCFLRCVSAKHLKEMIGDMKLYKGSLFNNRFGIISKALDACLKFDVLGEEVIGIVLDALNIQPTDRRNAVPLVLYMRKSTDYESKRSDYKIQPQGVEALQKIFSLSTESSKIFVDR